MRHARIRDYRDFGGSSFPTRIAQSQGGFPVLDLTVRDVQPNAPADIAGARCASAAPTERVTADKVVDGVWFIAGGSHNSVAIEMKDHLILVEAPLSEGRTGAGDRRSQASSRPEADPLRDQLASAFRPLRRACARRPAKARRSSRRRRTRRTSRRRSPCRTRSRPIGSRSRARRRSSAPSTTSCSLTDGTRRVELYHIADSHHTDTS